MQDAEQGDDKSYLEVLERSIAAFPRYAVSSVVRRIALCLTVGVALLAFDAVSPNVVDFLTRVDAALQDKAAQFAGMLAVPDTRTR